MKKVTAWLMGHHTACVVAFFISGNVMHWFHRLDGTYISYMTVLMGFVLGHSIREDYAKPKSDTN